MLSIYLSAKTPLSSFRMGQIDPTALGLCITFPLLAIFAVIARFCARHIKKTPLGLDDWVILVALIFAIGNGINALYGAIKADLGQHVPLDPQGLTQLGPKVTALDKMAYASETVVTLTIGLARWSILIFYSKLFTIRAFKIPVRIMYALNGAWTAGFALAYLMQCIPIDHLWTQSEGARTGCIDDSINYYYAISSVILDTLVLCMPWPMIWRLQMPLRRKLAVLGILMLGAIIVGVSIGKCYTFFTIGAVLEENHDVTYDERPLFYWTVPECSLSVVCACLPTLRPIFHGMSPESVVGSVRSAFSLPSLRSRSPRGSEGSKAAGSIAPGRGGRTTESTDHLHRSSTNEARDERLPDSFDGLNAAMAKDQFAMHDLVKSGKAIRVQHSFSTINE